MGEFERSLNYHIKYGENLRIETFRFAVALLRGTLEPHVPEGIWCCFRSSSNLVLRPSIDHLAMSVHCIMAAFVVSLSPLGTYSLFVYFTPTPRSSLQLMMIVRRERNHRMH